MTEALSPFALWVCIVDIVCIKPKGKYASGFDVRKRSSLTSACAHSNCDLTYQVASSLINHNFDAEAGFFRVLCSLAQFGSSVKGEPSEDWLS